MSLYTSLLKDALEELAVAAGDVIENADATGCTDDLTVTSAAAVNRLTKKVKAALAILRK